MTTENTVIHAEQCYLGACLLDGNAYWKSGHLYSSDFSHKRHSEIYEAIEAVMRHEGEMAPILVARCLPAENRESLYKYLYELLYETPTASTANYYADFIRLHSRLRRAYQHMRIGLDVGISGTLDEATAVVQRALEAARQALETEEGYTDFAEAVRQASMVGDVSHNRMVSTTIPSLDHVLRGLSGPRVYVVGARPSVGKSLLAGQIAANGAVRGNRAVGFISIEMSAGQLMSRMLAYLGNVPEHARMYFDDKVSDLGDITSRIRQWRCKHEIDLAVVDYLQIVRAPQYRARYEEVGAVSRELKRTAMELRIPILALAQLSREHEKVGRRPTLADLRECGNIEQDADVVMLMHPLEDRQVEIGVAKNRDGRSGTVVPLEFSPSRLALVERS
jgi:replicative DNA helicase